MRNKIVLGMGRLFVAGLVVVSGWAATGGRCEAGIVSASSRAFDESVNLTSSVLGVGTAVSSGPMPLAQGSAPTAYNNTNSLASTTVGPGLSSLNLVAASVDVTPVSLTMGGMSASAVSNVDSTLGSKTTSATSQVSNGFNLSLFNTRIDPVIGATLNVSGLSISATAFTVAAMVQGDYGGLVRSTSAYVENLMIKSNGATVYSYSGFLNPNTTISTSLASSLGGTPISILLNRQVSTGDGISSAGISTDLVSISLANTGINVLGSPVAALTGNLAIGHAEASMFASAAVPEPSSLVMMGCGVVGLVGFAVRRKVKKAFV